MTSPEKSKNSGRRKRGDDGKDSKRSRQNDEGGSGAQRREWRMRRESSSSSSSSGGEGPSNRAPPEAIARRIVRRRRAVTPVGRSPPPPLISPPFVPPGGNFFCDLGRGAEYWTSPPERCMLNQACANGPFQLVVPNSPPRPGVLREGVAMGSGHIPEEAVEGAAAIGPPSPPAYIIAEEEEEMEEVVNISRGVSELNETIEPPVSPLSHQSSMGRSPSSGFSSRGSSPFDNNNNNNVDNNNNRPANVAWQQLTFVPAAGGYNVTYAETWSNELRITHYFAVEIDPMLATQVPRDGTLALLNYFGARFNREPDGSYRGIYFQDGPHGEHERQFQYAGTSGAWNSLSSSPTLPLDLRVRRPVRPDSPLPGGPGAAGGQSPTLRGGPGGQSPPPPSGGPNPGPSWRP